MKHSLLFICLILLGISCKNESTPIQSQEVTTIADSEENSKNESNPVAQEKSVSETISDEIMLNLSYSVVEDLLTEASYQNKEYALAAEFYNYLHPSNESDFHYAVIEDLRAAGKLDDTNLYTSRLGLDSKEWDYDKFSSSITRLDMESLNGILGDPPTDNKPFEQLKAKIGVGNFAFLSRPFFTTDGQTAVIRVHYFCGYQCGQGTNVVLKKLDDKWVKQHEIVDWTL